MNKACPCPAFIAPRHIEHILFDEEDLALALLAILLMRPDETLVERGGDVERGESPAPGSGAGSLDMEPDIVVVVVVEVVVIEWAMRGMSEEEVCSRVLGAKTQPLRPRTSFVLTHLVAIVSPQRLADAGAAEKKQSRSG